MADLFLDFFDLPNCKYIGNHFEKKAITENKKQRYKLVRVFEFEYAGPIETECPYCHSKLHVHSNRTLTLTDTPFGGKPVELVIAYSRKRCSNPDCPKKYIWTPNVVDLNNNRNMTSRAYLDIAQRSLRNTFNEITNDYALSENTIKNVFIDFANYYNERLRFKTPAFLGIDEIKIPHIGEITVVTDLEHRTVFDMFPHRDQDHLSDYFSKLPDADKVLWVCSDMYRPFEKSIATALPNATWVIDHFHVVAKANEAVDFARRQLQDSMSRRDRIDTKRGLAYTLKTRERDLDPEEAAKIRVLRDDKITPKSSPKKLFVELYDLKEAFFNIYDDNLESKANAQKAFAEWEASIPDDPLFDKFRDLVKTVHNNYEQIFNYWDCPIAISNGYTECQNRLIREDNIRGRGYTFDILRARTLYRKTNLERALEHGLLYGPTIPKDGPVFFMEATDSDDDEEFDEEETEDYEDDDVFPTRKRASASYEDEDEGEEF